MYFEFKQTPNISTLSNKETESKVKKKHEDITILKQEFSSPLDGDNDNGEQFKLSKNSTEMKSSSSPSLESLNTMKITKVSVNRHFSISDAPIPLKFTPVNIELLPSDLLSDSQNKTIHELLSHNESYLIKQKRITNEIVTIRSSVNSIETIQKKFIHGLKVCLQNGDINYNQFLDPFKLLISRQIEISNYVGKISKLLKNLKPEKSDTLDSVS
ncbi:hypothetical protein Smp_174030 [Schistosoma mansoni]|uniref:hypothetical protein n=1 Tax=Schistosoma mansoni TaxID=6183 RepID=UPI00019B384B|nr:hypothetical protein Smp_174030 [Schistosoma mansoni]|eukprot:XP_018649188.1 hypothetical protein Smp_174030 [Schistosoma mansoni]